MSRIDLHLHTTHSDGSLRPSDVLTLAKAASVTALAITDHDITSGIPEALANGEALGIEVIPGVEVSSFDGKSELHILGYCMNWQDPLFNDRLATLRASRHRRNPLIMERLRAAGLDVTYDEVRALAGTESVGRPHIAQLLMKKRYVTSVKEAFDRFLAEGRPAYVARELPTPAEAIGWIREAKGVAVLAHPTWVKESGDGLKACVASLKEAGLGGIEVHYSTHSKTQTSDYLELGRHLNLLITGGSDFHGLTKPDIDVGTGRGDLKVSPGLLAPLKEAAARL
jgi:predicted metal-dependent phosphoesterase TrpH